MLITRNRQLTWQMYLCPSKAGARQKHRGSKHAVQPALAGTAGLERCERDAPTGEMCLSPANGHHRSPLRHKPEKKGSSTGNPAAQCPCWSGRAQDNPVLL